MISSALFFKISSCAAVGAFLTIGVPLIVHAEEKKAILKTERQAEIDNPENISKFFAVDKSWTINEGETISEKAIEKWTPEDKYKTEIAANWTKKLGSMTNAFLKKTQVENWAKISGVCQLKIHRVSIEKEALETDAIYVPFLKTSLTQIPTISKPKQLKATTTSAKATGQYIIDGSGKFLKITTQETLVKELKNIKEKNFQSTAMTLNGYESKRAADLLFLQELYSITIHQVKKLNNSYTRSTTDKPVWSYDGC